MQSLGWLLICHGPEIYICFSNDIQIYNSENCSLRFKKGVGTFPHRDKIIYGLCIAAFIVRATVLPLCKWVISPGPDEAYLTSNYVLTVYLTPPWHSPCTWEDHGGNPTGSNVKECSKLPLKKYIYMYLLKQPFESGFWKSLTCFFSLFGFLNNIFYLKGKKKTWLSLHSGAMIAVDSITVLTWKLQ